MRVKITFEDVFSFAKEVKETEADESTFNKMTAGIGSIVKKLDNGISYNWKVIKVEKL